MSNQNTKSQIPNDKIMIKTINSRYILISITLAFILLTTLAIGNIGASYQESNTLNYGKIIPIADDNDTFSDLSRNMSMQTGS
jgi:hypothetical protein